MCSLSDIFRKLSKAFILITVVKVANLSNAKSNCETRMRRGHKSQCCEEENRKIITATTLLPMLSLRHSHTYTCTPNTNYNNVRFMKPLVEIIAHSSDLLLRCQNERVLFEKNCSCAIRTPLEMNEMCDAARISGYVFVFRHTHTHTFIHGVSIDSISIFTLIYRW